MTAGACAPARHLKACFPHLKIGGYGSCGFYAAVGSDHVAAANSSPRMRYFVDCACKFLDAARKNGWPLDFFSYHSYSNPQEALRQVRFADELLNEYGATADVCARVFNEWLPFVGHDNLGTTLQAAGVAAKDGKVAVMIANPTRAAKPLTLKGVPEGGVCRLTDGAHTHAVVPLPAELPPRSFLVLSPSPAK